MLGVSNYSSEKSNIKVKIRNMKRRSSSRESPRSRKRKTRSNYSKYNDTSDDDLSPERPYRHNNNNSRYRSRSPSNSRSRHGREKSKKHHKENDNMETTPSFKVLLVSALHPKASDDEIRDVLYNEYKKFGDVSIRVSHDLEERVAYACFKSCEEAREAKKCKPRLMINEKIALVEPVYVGGGRNSEERYPKQRSGSYSPDSDRYYRRSSPTDAFRTAERFYERIPYATVPIVPREYRTAAIPHPDFLPRPILPAALPPHLAPGPHLYVPPRPFIPYKPITQYLEKIEKKDKFPNYLHHVPPEDDPLATRTLFAGNLELSITEDELRRIFNRYGVVEDIDIKRPMPGTGNAYAFVRYQNLDMAHRAKVELSGQYIGKFQCKIGYGKATPTTRIWVGGLGPWTSSTQLEREFDRFGAIKKIDYDKTESCAYILYDSIDAATAAVKEMRGFPLGGSEHKLRVDFADIGSYKPRTYNVDDVAVVAGDYRAQVNYDAYEPWSGSIDEFEYPLGTPWIEDKIRRAYRTDSSSNEFIPEEEWKNGNNNDRPFGPDCTSTISDEYTTNGISTNHRSLVELSRGYASMWQGALVLKSSLFPARLFLTDGDPDVIDTLMVNDDKKPILRISQRLRLDETKMEDVEKRMLAADNHAIFLGLSAPESTVILEDHSVQTRPLKNLISYLKQKKAAGVIPLSCRNPLSTGVLYAFPPCDFSHRLIKKTDHDLNEANLKEDHLVVIVINGDII